MFVIGICGLGKIKKENNELILNAINLKSFLTGLKLKRNLFPTGFDIESQTLLDI